MLLIGKKGTYCPLDHANFLCLSPTATGAIPIPASRTLYCAFRKLSPVRLAYLNRQGLPALDTYSSTQFLVVSVKIPQTLPFFIYTKSKNLTTIDPLLFCLYVSKLFSTSHYKSHSEIEARKKQLNLPITDISIFTKNIIDVIEEYETLPHLIEAENHWLELHAPLSAATILEDSVDKRTTPVSIYDIVGSRCGLPSDVIYKVVKEVRNVVAAMFFDAAVLGLHQFTVNIGRFFTVGGEIRRNTMRHTVKIDPAFKKQVETGLSLKEEIEQQ